MKRERKFSWIIVIAGLLCGALLTIGAFVVVLQSFSQDKDPSKELEIIIKNQVLPADYEKLPYIPYASLSGALQAYRSMPKPTYIIQKSSMLSTTKDPKDAKLIILYRVYFTPKPGVSYEIPDNKIVRNADEIERY